MDIKEAISKVVNHENMNMIEASAVMTQIMEGEATPSQIASFITAMRMKGETADEITGFVKVMREKAVKVRPKSSNLVDTCGTGGDKLNTFNISTTAAFAACGAGVKIAKHGNRAASSKCGSADVLEALGVNLHISAEQIAMCIDKVGIGFMFAPNMHPAMKHAVPSRREIGIRTYFNIVGPMTNPAGADNQLIGVFAESATELMINVLQKLGSKHALVVHGLIGLDEISTVGKTKISELHNGVISHNYYEPEDFGISSANIEDITIGDLDAAENAAITLAILNGEQGARRDIVVINAAAVIYVDGMCNSIKDGVQIAQNAIDSGSALAKLNELIAMTKEMSA